MIEMDAGVAAFIIVMTSIICLTFLVASWMRRRPAGQRPGDTLAATRQVELLSAENANLTGQIGRLEERLGVLERIATDPSERTAREIEQLRQIP